MSILKFGYLATGLVSIFIGLSGLFRGEIQALGPLGIGDTVNPTDNPVKFWLAVVGVTIFGIILIHRVIVDDEL